MTLPNFVIIGAMKCATTTLAYQLAAQAGIAISHPKEPNYFSNDETYAKGLRWYESLFNCADNAELIGEASTHYTKLPTYPDTVSRLQSTLGDVKLIYVMRHPIDRLVSQYIHEWSQRVVTGDIESELRENQWMIDYGKYAMQISPWIQAFGAERVLPVFQERIQSSPQQELERVCAFLGHRSTPKWSGAGEQNVSSQRMRKSALRDAILEAPGLKQIRRGLVPKGVRDWAKNVWTMKKRPELPEALRAELVEIYDKDLCQLGELLGHDITCANFKELAASTPMCFHATGSSV